MKPDGFASLVLQRRRAASGPRRCDAKHSRADPGGPRESPL